jgi:VIT1/CCC1 family predicted Fe2+/Mn2+ transporter
VELAGSALVRELADAIGDPQSRRSWSLAAQDGCISIAGILLGFAGAGASPPTLLIAGTAGMVAGMLTTGGAKWAETAAERDAQLEAIAAERREVREQRDAERAELATFYEAKGLSPSLAARVARQLMVRAPLRAGLEAEHGVTRLISPAAVAYAGIGAALAYAAGAITPFLIAWYLPVDIEVWVITLAVAVTLTLTSLLGARAGRMDVRRTLRRSLIVGGITIVTSYGVGQLAF